MPELPDIAAYIAALEPRVMGVPLEGVRLSSPFLLRTTALALSEAAGRTVRELRRLGKRIAIGLDGDLWLVLRLRDFFPGRGEACLAPTRARCRGRTAQGAPRGPRR
jgi:formamidopyrimidine-DNA glycosylase